MIESHEEIVIEKRIKVIYDRFYCDVCGKEGCKYNRDWSEGVFKVLEIMIEKKEGERYPGYENTNTENYHCCSECWKSVLVPIFKTGPTTKEYYN